MWTNKKRKEYYKKYYITHKEHIIKRTMCNNRSYKGRARLHRWYLKNRNKVLQNNAQYNKEHPDVSRRAMMKYRSKAINKIKIKKYEKRNATRLREYRLLYRKNNVDAIKNKRLLYRYGITLDQFNQMLSSQNERCAICDTPLILGPLSAVDHNHATGKVRQILCRYCNTGLGSFKENVLLLDKAKAYIEKWSTGENI